MSLWKKIGITLGIVALFETAFKGAAIAANIRNPNREQLNALNDVLRHYDRSLTEVLKNGSVSDLTAQDLSFATSKYLQLIEMPDQVVGLQIRLMLGLLGQ
jgi:hypothetical protein